MPIKKVNGIQMYYELRGKGTPVVLLAGFTGDHHIWQKVCDRLEKHFQVVLLDNRGAGQTEAPDTPYTVSLFAEDTLELLDTLNIASAHFIGQSMGAAIALEIAHMSPDIVDRLVLCNPFPRLNSCSGYAFKTALELRQSGADDFLVTKSLLPWVFSENFLEQNETLLLDLCRAGPHPQSLTGYRRQLEALLAFDCRQWLSAIEAPALILAGEQDITSPPEQAVEIAMGLQQGTLITIESAHGSLVETPGEVAKEAVNFLL